MVRTNRCQKFAILPPSDATDAASFPARAYPRMHKSVSQTVKLILGGEHRCPLHRTHGHGHLPQQVLLNLPCGRLGQLVPEQHRLRRHVMLQPLSAILNHLLLCRLLIHPFLQARPRTRPLTQTLVGAHVSTQVFSMGNIFVRASCYFISNCGHKKSEKKRDIGDITSDAGDSESIPVKRTRKDRGGEIVENLNGNGTTLSKENEKDRGKIL
ncbi:hypothetical protein AKJ16_DCAP05256 [Drosera capensis]